MFLVTQAGFSIGGRGEGIVIVALGEPLLDPWWEPLTANYAHIDWDHFFSNAIVIALFGTIVGATTTTLRFHAFFVATGVISSMVFVWVSNLAGDIPTIVLGSSGAGFALIGYTLALVLSGGLDWRQAKGYATLVIGGGAAALAIFLSPEGSAVLSHFVGALLGLAAGWVRLLSWSLR